MTRCSKKAQNESVEITKVVIKMFLYLLRSVNKSTPFPCSSLLTSVRFIFHPFISQYYNAISFFFSPFFSLLFFKILPQSYSYTGGPLADHLKKESEFYTLQKTYFLQYILAVY